MRKFVKCLVIPALVVGALVFASGRAALADGGHHHGHHGHHGHYSHYGHRGHQSYYGGGGGCYQPHYQAYGYRAYLAYPPYAVYRGPSRYYGGQTSFYNQGPNYSFGLSYGW
jgi:hypothetical protein